MRLVQLTGDNIEELWNFPDGTGDEEIEGWYREYEDDDEFDTFNEFMDEKYPSVGCERVFVDEIYL